MWYLAEVLFAEPSHPGRTDCQCEASNVVFQADSAIEAYRKAVAWGLDYAAEPPAEMGFVGVTHLTTFGEELGDGTEVCGRLFRSASVWGPAGELIPPPSELKAIQRECGRDTPLGELLSPEQVIQLRRVWGRDSESCAAADGGT